MQEGEGGGRRPQWKVHHARANRPKQRKFPTSQRLLRKKTRMGGETNENADRRMSGEVV